jgi:CheY-like chemotaxis protein
MYPDDKLPKPSSAASRHESLVSAGGSEWSDAQRAADQLAHDGYYLSPHDKDPCEGRRRVLVVDDEPLIGKAVSSVLKAEGFEVEWLDDGRDALVRIRRTPCLVLVLLDVMMPHINGFDVLRQIRAQEGLQRLPVAMLTAHADPEYVAEGLRAGADGYILKPFKPAKLIHYVHETLSQR